MQQTVTTARCFVKPVIVFILFFCATGMSSNENAGLQTMLYREEKPSIS